MAASTNTTFEKMPKRRVNRTPSRRKRTPKYPKVTLRDKRTPKGEWYG